jgi:hypothetical protein
VTVLQFALAALADSPTVVAAEAVADLDAPRQDIILTGAFNRDPRESTSPISVLAGEKLERDLRRLFVSMSGETGREPG